MEGNGGGSSNRDELASSARSLARRAHGLEQLGEAHGASSAFLRAIRGASELLGIAAEVLFNPGVRVPELSGKDGAAAPSLTPGGPISAYRSQVDQQTPGSQSTLLNGSTESVPLPEFLEFLSSLRKTGILWVKTKGETVTLLIEDGSLVHASTSRTEPGTRLGDVLLRKGFIDAAHLQAFLARWSRWNGKLGIALERDGLISREQLTESLEEQARVVFRRLFRLESATFSFSERPTAQQDNRIKLPLMALLLDTARQQDEHCGSAAGAPQPAAK